MVQQLPSRGQVRRRTASNSWISGSLPWIWRPRTWACGGHRGRPRQGHVTHLLWLWQSPRQRWRWSSGWRCWIGVGGFDWIDAPGMPPWGSCRGWGIDTPIVQPKWGTWGWRCARIRVSTTVLVISGALARGRTSWVLKVSRAPLGTPICGVGVATVWRGLGWLLVVTIVVLGWHRVSPLVDWSTRVGVEHHWGSLLWRLQRKFKNLIKL